MRTLSILGSTGSIGTQTLEVVRNHPSQFQVKALSAYRNTAQLAEQAIQFEIDTVCIADSSGMEELNDRLKGRDIEILHGRDGLLELAGRDNVDIMVNGLVSAAGMEPTINAVRHGVDVALSNKESMVMAGEFINSLLQEGDSSLYPVDSEHSAIWQCLQGEEQSQVRRLLLTGSGGPFRTRPAETFSTITREEALAHPNWDMGAKITIDSATMMNKGLEVIEARWLFDISADQIEIVVHPQSIIHSMVELVDGSVKAQLGLPDMKIPIMYAISYPDHLPAQWESLDLIHLGTLTFEAPDPQKFRCIRLAYDALSAGDSHPVVLNVANDEAVAAFLADQIGFTDIPAIIEQALEDHEVLPHPDLDGIRHLSRWTTEFVKKKIRTGKV